MIEKAWGLGGVEMAKFVYANKHLVTQLIQNYSKMLIKSALFSLR